MAKSNVKFGDYFKLEKYNWCTNCGNYGIAAATKRALVAEGIAPKDVVNVFDIGCNGNGADKINGYNVHGLHGRALAFAAGVAVANTRVQVIASAGDGGTMNEGINHLIHSVRSNYNMVFLLHNNSNFGLTKGQPSCTTQKGVPMSFAPDGIPEVTLNPSSLVLSMEPTFVARGFSGDVKGLTKVIQAGIRHKGFAFIEVFQACPTYNKQTPHEWFQERVYDVGQLEDYDPKDLLHARDIAEDIEKQIAVGILYQNNNRPDFLNSVENRKDLETELIDEVRQRSIQDLVRKFR